jgi:hypothetical protein
VNEIDIDIIRLKATQGIFNLRGQARGLRVADDFSVLQFKTCFSELPPHIQPPIAQVPSAILEASMSVPPMVTNSMVTSQAVLRILFLKTCVMTLRNEDLL